MRQLSGRVNRAWLAVIGIVVLVAGTVAVLIGLGLLPHIITAAGIGVPVPAPSNKIVASGIGDFFDQPVVVVAVGVLGVILSVLGLAWLLAQVPRANAARPFRFQDDAVRGLTVCDADVLTDAVEAEAKSLPGVSDASAVLRGTARAPELTIRISVNDRADFKQLLRILQAETAAHLAGAMEAQLKHLAVQVDVTTTRRTSDRVTL